jgi:transaldolase
MFLEKEKFALWVDFIERDFINNGLKDLVNKKIVNGATSNPAIFKSAFLTSPAYKEDIAKLKGTMTPKEIYETLAVKDIQAAADVLRPLFDANDDGFVSIEVDPTLANDAKATIAEGERLYKMIDRPNVMIKVPATDAGYEAMESLVASGISVNSTLIFSLTEALSCTKAFEKGQAKTDKDVHTVVSVFVSRVDRKLDEKLSSEYQAKAGIVNAAMIYNHIEKLAVKNNRTLFASTGVKGDSLHPAYYVSGLLAANSVNTTPLDTIESFVKEGSKEIALPLDQKDMDDLFQHLVQENIDLSEVLLELKAEGLTAFEEAFEEIMQSLQG